MQSVRTLIRGRWVMTDPRLGDQGITPEGAVAVGNDGTVVETGLYADLRQRYPEAPVEGGSNLLVMPGLVDAHSHGSGLSYLELGLGYDHLEYWNTYLEGLNRPDPYLDHLWCGLKHLWSGCTTIHHMGGPLPETVENAVLAYRDLGIRWALSLTVKDQNLITYDDECFQRNLPDHLQEAFRRTFGDEIGDTRTRYLEAFEEAVSRWHRPGRPVGHAPMGPQWCSEELLGSIGDSARWHQVRVHMHAIQTPYQREWVHRYHGISPGEYIDRMGLLGPDLTIGHAVWMTGEDLDRLAASGSSVTHHASCNLNMRNGIMPLAPMLSRGINVAVGIDGKGLNDDEDMIQEMRLVEKLHRIADLSPGSPPGASAQDVVIMATIGGAQALGLEDVTGTLEAGKAADILAIDMSPRPYLHPDLCPYEILVLTRKTSDVQLVMVEGNVLLREGEPTRVDQLEVARDLAASVGGRPWSPERHHLMEELRPYLVDFFSSWQGAEAGANPYYVVNRRD